MTGGGESSGGQFPIGSVIMSTLEDSPGVGTNPSTSVGYGTWAAWVVGRSPIGVDTGNADINIGGKTAGALTVALGIGEFPSHDHLVPLVKTAGTGAVDRILVVASDGDTGSRLAVTAKGSGNAHNNLHPVKALYFWERTA